MVVTRFALSGTNETSRPRFTTRGLGAMMLIGHYHGLA